MKKITYGAASLMFVASLFAGCGQQASTEAAKPATDSTGMAAGAPIAYVNTDSLLAHYDMYTELSSQFQEKSSKAETNITSRGRNLQSEVNKYQDNMNKGLVTRTQALTIENDLQNKQQAFVQYRDQLVNELAEEEQVMMNRIHYSILDFLKEFNADKRYGMILSTSTGGPVLDADPSLDITPAVIEGINKYYARIKTEETPAAK
ncbi:MAG: OmpH family outer membrane protein [Rikenellaceae bacterium]|jgi:outer membrane protein|nr:OmpH family outer membrane protein [Rikenellaceae bacterium]